MNLDNELIRIEKRKKFAARLREILDDDSWEDFVYSTSLIVSLPEDKTGTKVETRYITNNNSLLEAIGLLELAKSTISH